MRLNRSINTLQHQCSYDNWCKYCQKSIIEIVYHILGRFGGKLSYGTLAKFGNEKKLEKL